MQPAYSKFVVMVLLLALARIGSAADPETASERDARIELAQQNLKEAQTAMFAARLNSQAVQREIREQTGLVEVAPDAVRRLIAMLQAQREQLELDDVGIEGRRQALEEAIAKLSKKLEARVASDEVARELAKVVEIRRSQLERTKKLRDAAQASQDDVDTAEANGAFARAELAGARQKAMSNSSAEALDAWNRELLELTVTAQERQARLKYVSQRLSSISKAMDNLDSLELARVELIQARQAAVKAEADLRDVRARMDQAGMDEQQHRKLKTPATRP